MRILAIVLVSLMLHACGETPAPGNSNELRIVRDDYGVPHIYADSVYGLFYGYGYSIAQDRLFQMEMARRSTQGTVAEVLGTDYLEYDKNARILFSPASIRRQIDELAEKDRDVFEGYAEGFNAWLSEIRDAPGTLLPKQFVDLGFEPSDWSAYDVAMVFIGTMNNRYGDFNTELENAGIYKSLVEQHGEAAGQALFDLLNPRFTDDGSTTIPVEDWSRPAYDALATETAQNTPPTQLQLASEFDAHTGFSNCFIIGKDKVDGGGAILINGPQFGWFNPAYVYSIGMHGAGIDVVGNTPFGYPMIMFGHNATITWGSTWGASDIVDIYAEQLDPESNTRYLYKGEYRDFEHRVERIVVKDAEAVDYGIYRSVHGPVIRMDEEAGVAYAKKRAWDGRELENLLSWLHATWAGDFGEWKAQAEKASINVNMYFADVDGNIGYFHGGHFPQRTAGHDNRLPANGDGSMDWLGRQDINTANPHILNPSTGFIANWNNKPGQGVMNPDFFFYSWSSADRNEYLHNTLSAQDTFTPDEAWAILDSSSHADVFARYFLPLINEAVIESDDAALLEVNLILQTWDRESRDEDADGFYDEKASGIFRAFVGALIERTLKDDLGPVYPYFAQSGYPTHLKPTGAGTNITPGVKAIVEGLNGSQRYDLFNGEPVSTLVLAALREAVDIHYKTPLPVAKRPFSTSNFLGIPQAGEEEHLSGPIEQNRGTENNMIVMHRDAIVGWEVTPPGQSGFIAPDGTKNEHYDDQFEMYHRFGKKRMWFYPDDVEANKASEIALTY